MTHVATFADWSDGEMAKTWGVRRRSSAARRRVPRAEPYSALAVSDRFGVHANVPNDLLPRRRAPTLTIERAYWWTSPSAGRDGPARRRSAGHFLVHVREGKPGIKSAQYKAFRNACGQRSFLLTAKEGEAPVRAQATRRLLRRIR
jgi:hypothetical protein